MSSYRCAGCRKIRIRPEYRRTGLGSVCCVECFEAARAERSQRTIKKSTNDIPPNIRSQVYERDGNRCRYCGTTSSLHQHHINYRSQGIDHSAINLITLCAEHHATVHSDKARWQPVCMIYVAESLAGRRRFLLSIDREITR